MQNALIFGKRENAWRGKNGEIELIAMLAKKCMGEITLQRKHCFKLAANKATVTYTALICKCMLQHGYSLEITRVMRTMVGFNLPGSSVMVNLFEQLRAGV